MRRLDVCVRFVALGIVVGTGCATGGGQGTGVTLATQPAPTSATPPAPTNGTLQAQIDTSGGSPVTWKDVRVVDHGASMDTVMFPAPYPPGPRFVKLANVASIRKSSSTEVEFTFKSGEKSTWDVDGRAIVGVDTKSTLEMSVPLEKIEKVTFVLNPTPSPGGQGVAPVTTSAPTSATPPAPTNGTLQAQIDISGGSPVTLRDVEVFDHTIATNTVMFPAPYPPGLRYVKLADVASIRRSSSTEVEFTFKSGEKSTWDVDGRAIVGVDTKSTLKTSVPLDRIEKVSFVLGR
jgi:hypothetical protein